MVCAMLVESLVFLMSSIFNANMVAHWFLRENNGEVKQSESNWQRVAGIQDR